MVETLMFHGQCDYLLSPSKRQTSLEPTQVEPALGGSMGITSIGFPAT